MQLHTFSWLYGFVNYAFGSNISKFSIELPHCNLQVFVCCTKITALSLALQIEPTVLYTSIQLPD